MKGYNRHSLCAGKSPLLKRNFDFLELPKSAKSGVVGGPRGNFWGSVLGPPNFWLSTFLWKNVSPYVSRGIRRSFFTIRSGFTNRIGDLTIRSVLTERISKQTVEGGSRKVGSQKRGGSQEWTPLSWNPHQRFALKSARLKPNGL